MFRPELIGHLQDLLSQVEICRIANEQYTILCNKLVLILYEYTTEVIFFPDPSLFAQ